MFIVLQEKPKHSQLPNPVFFSCYDGNVVTQSVNPGRTVPKRTIARIQSVFSQPSPPHLSQIFSTIQHS